MGLLLISPYQKRVYSEQIFEKRRKLKFNKTQPTFGGVGVSLQYGTK